MRSTTRLRRDRDQGPGDRERATRVGRRATRPGCADRVLPRPAGRGAYTQHSPQGSLIKCEAIYGQPFWRAAGLSGNVVSAGPAKICYDGTPAAGTPGGVLGFVGGDVARRFGGHHEALQYSTSS